MTSSRYCERRLPSLIDSVALLSLLVLIVVTAHAQSPVGSQRGPLPPAAEIRDLEDSVNSDKRQPLTLSRVDQTPVIDGRVDEAVWRSAVLLKDFLQTQPGDNIAAPHPTEVRIAYDPRFLYIAIHALDQSGQVRATMAKRDDLSGNDYVSVWLDTFNDQRRAYVLLFNPLGVQADGIFTEGQGIDYSFDLVMQSKGTLTADGYTIEVAIPFASLRYDAGPGKLWGLHVLRLIRHLDEWDTWMPLRRESRDFNTATFIRFVEQAGHIGGIENVGRKRTLELIPTLTLSETGRRLRSVPRAQTSGNAGLTDSGRFVNQPMKIEPGLTAKLMLSSAATLDAALNPDFAQVEADQLVVTANQRFPIFYDEKRPFFLEGNDIFRTAIKVVHTRTIIDPDFALKLTGKRGRNSFGLLWASDNAPGDFSDEERNDPAIRPGIGRFLTERFHRCLATETRPRQRIKSRPDSDQLQLYRKHNQVLGVDGRLTLSPKTIFSFQLLGTTSRRFFYDSALDENVYRTGTGFGYYIRLQRTVEI